MGLPGGLGRAIGSTGMIAGNAAASGGLSLPLDLILMFLASGGLDMFGGKSEVDTQAAEDMAAALENMGLNAPYQSSLLENIDPVVANAVLQNFGRYANWGFPEDMQMDTGFMNDLLANLQSGSPYNPKMLGGKIAPQYADRSQRQRR